MKVLVIGRGGREHALCEKIKDSPLVSHVYVAPGNPGMRGCAELLPYSECQQTELVRFARDEGVDLILIGPEQPLIDGLADRFHEAGLKVFAPSRRAAEIEGSKAFAKQLMVKYGIPTADYRVFADYEAARAYLADCSVPVVIKADGLAAGKGVVVAETRSEAEAALLEMLVERRHGSASAQVIIEEFLEGEEFSLMALVHGDLVVPLEIAQDHKRAFDGDLGPNTGGMGAYSPVPQIGSNVVSESLNTVLKPTVQALLAEGRFFSGILYAGLIVTKDGPKAIEFNARLGDPETQVILPRLRSDLVSAILALMEGERPELSWDARPMLGIVVASQGYPHNPIAGAPLPTVGPFSNDLRIYYGGVTENSAGNLISSGGRSFLVAAFGDRHSEAREKVYSQLRDMAPSGFYYRADIGRRFS